MRIELYLVICFHNEFVSNTNTHHRTSGIILSKINADEDNEKINISWTF